jgi:pyruvate dehydrogenase E2 component (dihydrolipoamide acetyltransferase)
MAISVVMPALEMAQETGKLVAWRKKEGEQVSKGEPLLEVETDKAVMEVEALADGVLAGITAEVGADIPVGKTIAWILAPGESVPTAAAKEEISGRAATIAAPVSEPVRANTAKSAGAVQVSPKARRLAQERGVDLTHLRGTGPDGAITTDDVLAAAGKSTAAAPASSSVARLMAERTTQSWTTVPHFFLTRDVDVSALVIAKETLADGTGPTVTYTDLLVAALAQSLRQHPRANSSFIDGSVRENPNVNVALAIAVPDAVVTAVIPQTDKLSIPVIAEKRKGLAERARAGRLAPADVSGGTFTISNLGMFGVDAFQAIIVPPQAAILAVGRIHDRVVSLDGEIAVRPMMTLTLSCDHRVLDGATAAMFLQDLADNLERAAA